ncbi:CD8A protein, partial [Scytalopus superciliaris]|nr:CD8A protein [Scytalopus superciliaris]
MDRSPVLLLLLALGLCCPGIHGQHYELQVRFRNSITQLREGQRLELECQTDKNSGAFWVRQDKTGNLHFIVFISQESQTTFKGNQGTSIHFTASKNNAFYLLVVKSFTQQDEGNYFCLVNDNQMLYFSHGLPAFLPVHPFSLIGTTTPGPTTQRGTTIKESNSTTLNPESCREKVNFFCNIVLWVPLAGACLLLLIALAITILLCQR